jgi:hypothetical protein
MNSEESCSSNHVIAELCWNKQVIHEILMQESLISFDLGEAAREEVLSSCHCHKADA